MHNSAADACYELAQVPTLLLQTLAEVAEDHGVDPVQLCRGLGFTVEDLRGPTQRISYCQAMSMIQRTLQALSERGLGLWVGHQNVLGTLGLLGHVLSLCRTLHGTFDIGVHYQHSSGGIAASSVYQQGETFFVEVECHLPSNEIQVFVIEEFFASLLVYGHALVGPVFKPLGVELIHAAPPYAGEYLRLLDLQVRLGCLHNHMAIANHWLDMRLPNHNLPTLRQTLALLGQESTQVHRKLDLVQAVERAIACDLSLGSQIERIFAELNMSSRILRRRLAEHGLTFKVLPEQVRRGRVMSLLGNPGMSVERIAEEVGYRDIRSFRYAFERRTGVSPATFRSEGASPLGQAFALAVRRQGRTAMARRNAPWPDDQ